MRRVPGLLILGVGLFMVLHETFSMEPVYVLLFTGLFLCIVGVLSSMDPMPNG